MFTFDRSWSMNAYRNVSQSLSIAEQIETEKPVASGEFPAFGVDIQ